MTNHELKSISKYKLKKMFTNNEIDKCPKCKKYHVGNKKYKNSLFLVNRTLCENCQEKKDYYENFKNKKGETK